MRAALGLLALLLLVPAASAQVPDPADVVETACAVAGTAGADDLLPVCPREEPQPAAPADEEAAHDHGAAPASPEQAADEALDLAGEAVETVESIPEDPAGAPEAILAFVATIVQLVKDILGVPAELAIRIDGAFDDMREAAATGLARVGEGAKETFDGAKDAIGTARDAVAGALERVKELLARPDASVRAPEVRAPRAPALDDAASLLDALPVSVPQP